jgi:Abortive infection C-terminus
MDPIANQRVLRVYHRFLDDHVRNASFLPDDHGLPPEATTLPRSLQRDGAPVDDEGQLLGSATPSLFPLSGTTSSQKPRAVIEHLDRITASIDNDPAAVLASAKELVETACKLILDDLADAYNQRAELADLYKTTAQALRVSRDSVPGSAKGSQTAQRILQNLASTVQGLAELRNELGLGHGRAKPSPALARHARLSASRRPNARGVPVRHMARAPVRPALFARSGLDLRPPAGHVTDCCSSIVPGA